jgi:polyphosphate glucokinase
VLLVTAGTGIGVALFCRKQLYPNAEIGHLVWKGMDAETYVAASARTKENLSWKQWARRFDGYLRELERLLWPELIIIGGGVSEKHREWFKYLRLRAPVVPAKLLNDAGIVGAALATKLSKL